MLKKNPSYQLYTEPTLHLGIKVFTFFFVLEIRNKLLDGFPSINSGQARALVTSSELVELSRLFL